MSYGEKRLLELKSDVNQLLLQYRYQGICILRNNIPGITFNGFATRDIFFFLRLLLLIDDRTYRTLLEIYDEQKLLSSPNVSELCSYTMARMRIERLKKRAADGLVRILKYRVERFSRLHG